MVLIPKGITNTRGIGLLETLWKVVEALIDTRLRVSLQFHYVLHGFRAGIGMRKDIMEPKLTLELSSVYHEPLFLVFLQLRKAYNTVYRDRLVQKFKGYGAGSCMFGLM